MSQEPETTTTTHHDDTNGNKPVTPEELLDLVQAIQFSKPNVSQTQVLKEITQRLSQKPGFDYLSKVKISDVQKAWKKLRASDLPATPSTANGAGAGAGATNDGLRAKLPTSTPELFTVGKDNSVAFLAQELTAAALAEPESNHHQAASDQNANDDTNNYVHIFLDVPMDKSGSKPHQALISFQKPAAKSSATSDPGAKKGNNKKKNNNKKKQAASVVPDSLLDDQGRMVVKIQRAAPPEGTPESIQYPMLLYNKTRSHKTFLHPGEEYDKILHWMQSQGQTGALGNQGGTKAYFYARLSLTAKGMPDVLSLDVSQLAPIQEW